ncbi:class I SAM-dependent methyltransferase [Corallococcus aberystwythensis]|nr:class I SAM-dependent methyltransferase [Corallococcus aberystwythensis]
MNHYLAVFEELLEAVVDSGLYTDCQSIRLALLGPKEDRECIRARILSYPKITVVHETEDFSEFEFPALERLQELCDAQDAYVFYAHTKGVSHGPTHQYPKHWRRLLIHHTLSRYHECVGALADHDCSGVNWVENHYSGNFWWTKSSYVRTLPRISGLRHSPVRISQDATWNARLQCEFWIGMARAKRPFCIGGRGHALYNAFQWIATRTDILNALIARYGFSRYLEIGIGDPVHNFERIVAALKHSVDPAPGATYRMGSDAFFASAPPEQRYDLIFIDGLHEEEQVLRDIEGALARLTPEGAVVLHDTNPPTEWHQRPPEEYASGTEWNGTVWRAVVRFRLNHPEVPLYTVDTDWGCTVIRPADGPAQPLSGVSANDLTWAQLDLHRDQWLNLLPLSSFQKQVMLRR